MGTYTQEDTNLAAALLQYASVLLCSSRAGGFDTVDSLQTAMEFAKHTPLCQYSQLHSMPGWVKG